MDAADRMLRWSCRSSSLHVPILSRTPSATGGYDLQCAGTDEAETLPAAVGMLVGPSIEHATAECGNAASQGPQLCSPGNFMLHVRDPR